MRKKLLELIKKPWRIILYLNRHGFGKMVSDKMLIKALFRENLDYKLNLKNPRTFNEKLQWLKLYDRKEEYTRMVDKYEAKQYIKDKVGEKYIVPTLGVWDNVEDIDFKYLPEKFVLKCTHDSGSVVIVRDKQEINIKNIKKLLDIALRTDYYNISREWPYKNVKPRIIAEKYLEEADKDSINDYKIFCFNGEPKLIEVDINRFSYHTRNIYTLDWEVINMYITYPNNTDLNIKKPQKLGEMLKVAKKISEGIPFLRVDFYYVNNQIYIGEMTLFHGSGLEKFSPRSYDKQFGEWIVIPEIREK